MVQWTALRWVSRTVRQEALDVFYKCCTMSIYIEQSGCIHSRSERRLLRARIHGLIRARTLVIFFIIFLQRT